MGHSLDDGILYKSEEVRLLGDSICGLGYLIEKYEILTKKKEDGELSEEDFETRTSVLLSAFLPMVNEIKKQIIEVGLSN